MPSSPETLTQNLLTLLETQKARLRCSALGPFEAGSREVDELIVAWTRHQGERPISPRDREAVQRSLEQLNLMVAAARETLSDKIQQLRRHRRAVVTYSEGRLRALGTANPRRAE